MALLWIPDEEGEDAADEELDGMDLDDDNDEALCDYSSMDDDAATAEVEMELEPDHSIWEKFDNYLAYANIHNKRLPPEMKAGVDLMNLMSKKRVPLNL